MWIRDEACILYSCLDSVKLHFRLQTKGKITGKISCFINPVIRSPRDGSRELTLENSKQFVANLAHQQAIKRRVGNSTHQK